MSEIVVIPVYGREEMLDKCLAAIREAEPEIPIRLFIDRGYVSPGLVHLQQKYNAPGFVLPFHQSHGNNKIASEIFKWASKQEMDLLYYVESDVVLLVDFFTWARQHADGVFGCCGWANPINIPTEIHLQYFSAPAVALKLSSVIKIANHIEPNKMRAWDLQVSDLLLKTQQHCLFPYPKLASHIGYSGLNFNMTKPDTIRDTGFVQLHTKTRHLEITSDRIRIVRT